MPLVPDDYAFVAATGRPGLGSLYYCSPDEVIFLTTREAYEPHYVDDRKYFELDTFYQEFAKPWPQRRRSTGPGRPTRRPLRR